MHECIIDCKKTNAVIDLNAIAHNYNYTKKITGKRIICVIKADAYGHGALQVARRLEKEGADYFAVATVDEAMQLRRGGVGASILVLGYILPAHIKTAIDNNISLTAASLDFLRQAENASDGKTVKLHIKLNTGMNRTGFYLCSGEIPEDLKKAVSFIKEHSNLEIEGLYSHFANAEDDKAFTRSQFEKFNIGKEYLLSEGINAKICHICNSAGTSLFPEMHMDAVRLGISLYGAGTTDENYLPAMSFNTTIVDIHDIYEGDGVSYGLDYTAQSKVKMAVIGAGYADGLRRSLSGKDTYVLCNGKRVPLIGRVCMDMAMIDVSSLPDVKVGDVVTLWGKNQGGFISCDEQAEKAGTICYELFCCVSPRVPRIYIGE